MSSSFLNTLRQRERELKAQMTGLQGELADVQTAIQAVEARHSSARPAAAAKTQPAMKIDDAIIEAVGNDAGSPAAIHSYLERQLGVRTTRNSISTRLGKLKKAGRLDHDGEKWILPINKEALTVESVSTSKVTGEGASSPNESRGGERLFG